MFGVGSEVIPLNFFTKLGSENPRAKLEPKWPGPLWSSISNTVHVSTCLDRAGVVTLQTILGLLR